MEIKDLSKIQTINKTHFLAIKLYHKKYVHKSKSHQSTRTTKRSTVWSRLKSGTMPFPKIMPGRWNPPISENKKEAETCKRWETTWYLRKSTKGSRSRSRWSMKTKWKCWNKSWVNCRREMTTSWISFRVGRIIKKRKITRKRSLSFTTKSSQSPWTGHTLTGMSSYLRRYKRLKNVWQR